MAARIVGSWVGMGDGVLTPRPHFASPPGPLSLQGEGEKGGYTSAPSRRLSVARKRGARQQREVGGWSGCWNCNRYARRQVARRSRRRWMGRGNRHHDMYRTGPEAAEAQTS